MECDKNTIYVVQKKLLKVTLRAQNPGGQETPVGHKSMGVHSTSDIYKLFHIVTAMT